MTQAAATANERKNEPPRSRLRDAVETVVFVVVLVLLLKTFVAEAFVIPTGSMATTLWGQQKQVTCPRCGYRFPVNCSEEADPQEGPSLVVVGCTCTNCRYHIDLRREPVEHTGCGTGDRVLVGKYLTDLPWDRPERLDVVVFKFPQGPQKDFQPMNYIKRVLGLPGETLGLYYGDVYVLPPAERVPDDAVEAEAAVRAGRFDIVRKPPDVVLALRRLVYDTAHRARDLERLGFPPRWAPEEDLADDTSPEAAGRPDFRAPRRRAGERVAWRPGGDAGFVHPARPGELAWLRYRHLLFPRALSDRLFEGVSADAAPELITDFLGYNSWEPAWGAHQPPPANWVGDLLLECDLAVGPGESAPGDAALVLELCEGLDRFQARWDLAGGECTLVRLHPAGEEVLATRHVPLPAGTHHLLFANVDDRLLLWVDGDLPFGDGVAYPPPRERGPTALDLQPAGLGVRGAEVAVHRLRLWRDTYYTVRPGEADASPPPADWSDPDAWGPLRELPASAYPVEPGYYFCLGDNSPRSADSRAWGLVPERLLLGRAVLVYYPLRRIGLIE